MKVIQKIGVYGFSDQDILGFFDQVDENKNGKLEYKEFAGILYGNYSLAKNLPQTEETARSEVEPQNTNVTSKSKTKNLLTKE